MLYFKLKIKTLLFGILFLSVFLLVPYSASAANIYLSTDYPSISVGDTIIVNVMMDPQGKSPNVIDGNILIKNGVGNIKILELNTAGSVLTHWLQTPSLDSSSSISFVGGAPGGFNKTGILFKIVFLAEKEGKIVFLPSNIKAYNNDGKATPIEVSANSISLDVGPKKEISKNQWLDTISKDNQPPKQLSAVVGQDSSIFNGKKFITISAVDDQSGISYYEVKEGDWSIVRSGKNYVLLDQNEKSNIIVTAYDKAGNYSRIILKPIQSKINYWVWIIILVITLVIIYIIVKILKKRKRN